MKHPPDGVPEHLLEFLRIHGIEVEFVSPGVPMPSVSLAAQALGTHEDQILKTLLFVGDSGEFVVAIANGTRRIDKGRLALVAEMWKPRPATPADVIAVTGYAAGGVSPLGLPAALPVIVDAAAVELNFVYGGAGHESVLLRVRISDVIRYNNALVADITQRPKLVTN